MHFYEKITFSLSAALCKCKHTCKLIQTIHCMFIVIHINTVLVHQSTLIFTVIETAPSCLHLQIFLFSKQRGEACLRVCSFPIPPSSSSFTQCQLSCSSSVSSLTNLPVTAQFFLFMNPSVNMFMFSLGCLLWLPLLKTMRQHKVKKAFLSVLLHKDTQTRTQTHCLPLPSAWHSPWRMRKEMEDVYEAQMLSWLAWSHCRLFQPSCLVPVKHTQAHTHTRDQHNKHKLLPHLKEQFKIVGAYFLSWTASWLSAVTSSQN